MTPVSLNQTSPWTRFSLFPVELTDDVCFLSTDNGPQTKQRPVLDCHAGSILHFVAQKVKQVSFAAVVGIEFLHPKCGKSNQKPSPVEVTVNAYGPEGMVDEVGQAMTDVHVVLQHPVFLELETPYINPHYFYTQDQKPDLRHLIGPACKESKSAVSEAIDDALDSANDCDDGVSLAACDRDDLRNVLRPLLVDTQLKEYDIL